MHAFSRMGVDASWNWDLNAKRPMLVRHIVVTVEILIRYPIFVQLVLAITEQWITFVLHQLVTPLNKHQVAVLTMLLDRITAVYAVQQCNTLLTLLLDSIILLTLLLNSIILLTLLLNSIILLTLYSVQQWIHCCQCSILLTLQQYATCTNVRQCSILLTVLFKNAVYCLQCCC